MKRLLFLDFDGVLHPVTSKPGETLPFEWVPELAALLSEAPGVAIAVHSSWAERYSLDELTDFLGPLGSRLIGGVDRGPKASSILAFLRSRPEVEDWLVIDDEEGEIPADLRARLVICDGTRGISDPAIQDQIRRWLTMPVKRAGRQHK